MKKRFIRVRKPILETRTFSLNYITGSRTSTSSMYASVTGAGTSGTSGTSMGGTTSNINLNLTPSGTTTQGSQITGTGISQGNVNVTTSGTSNFWKEIRKGLEVIIFGDSKGGSDSEGGFSRGDPSGKKIVINELAGIVYVTDYSDNMEGIEDFLKDIEWAVRRQVMIQAHIIEVSVNDNYSFGINWSLIAGKGEGDSGELFNFSQTLVPVPETKIFQINLSDKK